MPVHGYNIHRIKKPNLKPLLGAIDNVLSNGWSDIDEPANPDVVARDLQNIRSKLLTRGPSISMNRSERETLHWFAYAWESAHPGSGLMDVQQQMWHESRSLSRLYGIREMSVEIPDKDVPSLDSVVKDAILAGKLPAEALHWLYGGKGKGGRGSAQQQQAQVGQPAAKGKKGKAKAEPKAQKAEPAQAASQPQPKPPAPKPVPPPTPPPAPAQAAQPVAQKPVPKRPSPEDVAQGAWSRMGGNGRVPTPSTGQEPDAQFDAPTPANVKLNKQGQPVKPTQAGEPDFSDTGKKPGALARLFKGKGKKDEPEPMAMQPKKGALSRIFKKKGQQFKDNPNPYEFQPAQSAGGTDWNSAGDPFSQAPAKRPTPLSGDGTQSGEETMADLGNFLGKNQTPGQSAVTGLKRDLAASPRSNQSPGQAAMNDLDWDLKRSPKRGKSK